METNLKHELSQYTLGSWLQKEGVTPALRTRIELIASKNLRRDINEKNLGWVLSHKEGRDIFFGLSFYSKRELTYFFHESVSNMKPAEKKVFRNLYEMAKKLLALELIKKYNLLEKDEKKRLQNIEKFMKESMRTDIPRGSTIVAVMNQLCSK